MTPRLDTSRYLQSGYLRAMLALQQEVDSSGLGHTILDLVKIRASQINGCAYCLDMHTKDARARGEREQRIYALDAWRETPFFDDRERAALEWTESVTLVGETRVPDVAYDRVREQFTEPELVALTFAAIAINAWNRLAIAARVPAGSYQPPHAAAAPVPAGAASTGMSL